MPAYQQQGHIPHYTEVACQGCTLAVLLTLESDNSDVEEDTLNWLAVSTDIQVAKKDGISREIGVRYPLLQSIMSGHEKLLSINVSLCYIACYIFCYITSYLLAGAGCILAGVHSCRGSTGRVH